MRRMRHLKPREIQGCQLALDASIASSLYDATSGGSLVAANGAVARWEDQSGSGNHVTQATSARRPARRVASTGGMDTLQSSSDAASHMVTSAFYPSAGSGDVTIVSVTIPLSAVYSVAWGYGENSGGRRPNWAPKYNTSRSAVDFSNCYVGRSGSPTETSSWHVHSYRASGAATVGDTDQRINMQSVSENYTFNPTTALNAGATRPFLVGSNNDATLRIGYMAMFASYNRALNASVQGRIEGSAMRKWRITG